MGALNEEKGRWQGWLLLKPAVLVVTGVDIEQHGAVCLAVLHLHLLVGGVVPHLLRVAGGVEQLESNVVKDWHMV